MKSLTKVLFKRKSIDEANIFYAMYPGIPWAQAHISEMKDDDDGDTRSIDSFSTTATVDDNPGTGRVLDTYFFQPAGRRIERLAMTFTIRHLHPSWIEAFIRGFLCFPYLDIKLTLSIALRNIDLSHFSGPTIISGLKSLVRQAQWVSQSFCKRNDSDYFTAVCKTNETRNENQMLL